MLAAHFDLEDHLRGKSVRDISLVERHLLKSLDGVLVDEHARALDTGAVYLFKILEMVGYVERVRDKLCEWMIFRLPSHNQFMQTDLAKDLGIAVENACVGEDEWNMMRWWLFNRIGMEDNNHFIRYLISNIKKVEGASPIQFLYIM